MIPNTVDSAADSTRTTISVVYVLELVKPNFVTLDLWYQIVHPMNMVQKTLRAMERHRKAVCQRITLVSWNVVSGREVNTRVAMPVTGMG